MEKARYGQARKKRQPKRFTAHKPINMEPQQMFRIRDKMFQQQPVECAPAQDVPERARRKSDNNPLQKMFFENPEVIFFNRK